MSGMFPFFQDFVAQDLHTLHTVWRIHFCVSEYQFWRKSYKRNSRKVKESELETEKSMKLDNIYSLCEVLRETMTKKHLADTLNVFVCLRDSCFMEVRKKLEITHLQSQTYPP